MYAEQVSASSSPSYFPTLMHATAGVMHALPQGGSDVITKTALKRINWSAYKINQSTDKVSVPCPGTHACDRVN